MKRQLEDMPVGVPFNVSFRYVIERQLVTTAGLIVRRKLIEDITDRYQKQVSAKAPVLELPPIDPSVPISEMMGQIELNQAKTEEPILAEDMLVGIANRDEDARAIVQSCKKCASMSEAARAIKIPYQTLTYRLSLMSKTLPGPRRKPGAMFKMCKSDLVKV